MRDITFFFSGNRADIYPDLLPYDDNLAYPDTIQDMLNILNTYREYYVYVLEINMAALNRTSLAANLQITLVRGVSTNDAEFNSMLHTAVTSQISPVLVENIGDNTPNGVIGIISNSFRRELIVHFLFAFIF